jgi:hypothetical protein
MLYDILIFSGIRSSFYIWSPDHAPKPTGSGAVFRVFVGHLKLKSGTVYITAHLIEAFVI